MRTSFLLDRVDAVLVFVQRLRFGLTASPIFRPRSRRLQQGAANAESAWKNKVKSTVIHLSAAIGANHLRFIHLEVLVASVSENILANCPAMPELRLRAALNRRFPFRCYISLDAFMTFDLFEKEKIEQFLPVLDQMIRDGLVTLERVRVIHYKANPANGTRH